MKKLFIIFVLIFSCKLSFSQSYLTSEVIEKAASYLKEAVGDSLFTYFELDPDSYYEYKTTSGKRNWRNINQGKRTKGTFVNGNSIRFTLKHPSFPYLYIRKNVYVPLDSNLNLSEEINLDRIPKFLLRNEPSNWLTDKELNRIIKSQNLKKAVKPFSKQLKYNSKTKEYYWIVFNILQEEKCFSDREVLHIHVISGKILKYYEGRFEVLHCND